MAFQIKNAASVAASMINYIKAAAVGLTDFNIGSVIRSFIDSAAAEFDELYQQMLNAVNEARTVATYQSFGFSKLGAQPASGSIRVMGATAAPAAGTVFSTDASSYGYIYSNNLAVVGAGYVDVPVTASASGAATNIVGSASFTAAPPIANMTSASNPADITGGSDIETDDQIKLRFAKYIASLSRGTVASLAYGAGLATVTNAAGLVIERAKLVSVVEPYALDNTQPIGQVNIYIHNGAAATSGALVAAAQALITGSNNAPGYKAAGTAVTVYAAADVPVSMTVALSVAPGYASPSAAVASAIGNYLAGLGIGAPFIATEAIRIAKSFPGVTDVTVSSPNVAPTYSQNLIPGVITVTP